MDVSYRRHTCICNIGSTETCTRVTSGQLSQMFKMNMKRDVREIDFEDVSG
jgi:hypothetical protein